MESKTLISPSPLDEKHKTIKNEVKKMKGIDDKNKSVSLLILNLNLNLVSMIIP